MWILAVGATIVLVVGSALIYRHLQHRKLGITTTSKVPPPILTEPSPVDNGIDLDKLKHACEYVEGLRAMGVDDTVIRQRLSEEGRWPQSYIEIAMK